MNIYLDTKIEELERLRLISQRTYNCLKNSGYDTMSDIINLNDVKVLKNIKNFGERSYSEIVELLKNNMSLYYANLNNGVDGYLASIIENAYCSLIYENDKCGVKMKANYPKPENLHTAIIAKQQTLLDVQPDLTREENTRLRYCYKCFIAEVLKSIDNNSKYNIIASAYRDALSLLHNNIDKFSELDCLKYFMTPEMRHEVQNVYEEACMDMLNGRALTFQKEHLPKVEDIVPYFDLPIERYNDIFQSGNKRKTVQDIFDFVQKFKYIYYRTTGMPDFQLSTTQYPFLSINRKRFIFEYKQKYGHFPFMYILYQYMLTSTERCDDIFGLLYGIKDGQERSNQEVGVIYGITGERVRQIVTDEFDDKNKRNIIKGFGDNNKAILSLPYVTEDSEEYIKINSSEKVNVNFRIFARLLTITVDYFIVEEVRDKIILINRNLMNGFKLQKCIRNLDKILSSKYPDDTKIPIYEILCKTPSDVTDFEKELLSYIITKIYGMSISNDSELIVKQNYIDIPMEVCNILTKNGRPMRLEEIFHEFKKKYPNSKYGTPESIRHYILKSKDIKAIGKQSTYALVSCKNVYFGSIRDCIIEIMTASNDPMRIDEIFAGVSKYYPETNEKSLYSTMQADELNRFVMFEGGYYGLSSKKYPNSYKIKRIVPRMSFVDRMDMYRNFIDTNHRFPFANSQDELESSLYRWVLNIRCGNIKTTDTQKTQFETLIDSYDKLGYPKNNKEMAFLNNCNDYKSFVDENHSLPTHLENKYLYHWYRSALANYEQFLDNRKTYFSDLLNYISNAKIGS